MEVDDFADFMFAKNINNAQIELSLGGVENNKDLFCFFVDLMCKGLVILFGKDNRIELEQLTIDDFNTAKKKMGLAGIEVILNITPNAENLPVSLNIREIEMFPDNAPIDTYFFKVVGLTMVYEIRFRLVKYLF
jgi:hypothetical protein